MPVVVGKEVVALPSGWNPITEDEVEKSRVCVYVFFKSPVRLKSRS